MKIRPFLKWVGGKTQLLREIEKRMPENFNNYLEPFIGGGALFFTIHNNTNNFIINDISSELINAYKAIKKDPQKLMKLLDKHQLNHSLNPKEYYYFVREQQRDINWNKTNIFIKTARLIYLNKTCFNGLYRVNKYGHFNVPWNKKETVKLYEENNILNLNRILNSNVEILNSDFEKVCKYAQKGDFIKIINDYPKVISILPLLLAITKYRIPVIDQYLITYNFKTKSMTNNEYVNFMKKTKLFDLFENNKIKNLVDYVTGIAVGLDSHARKNRTGFIMENLVESFIKKTNYIEFFKQIKKIDIANKYAINIDKLLVDISIKEAEKKFDFVVKTKDHLFLIEVNFYNAGGSKLNSEASRFKELSKSISKLDNITFVWITDGIGWKTAKPNLKEAYDEIENFYTLFDLENGVLEKLIK